MLYNIHLISVKQDFLPNNKSAIIIDDFTYVEDLAEFIKMLDKDDEEYRKYLTFKDEGGISNPFLLKHMMHRDWGQSEHEEFKRTRHHKHFDGFECMACIKAHSLLVDLQKGVDPEHSVAKLEHYGCPKPKTFDENGKYVVRKKIWEEPYLYSKYLAKAFRKNYEKNVTLKEKYLRQEAKYLRSKSGE